MGPSVSGSVSADPSASAGVSVGGAGNRGSFMSDVLNAMTPEVSINGGGASADVSAPDISVKAPSASVDVDGGAGLDADGDVSIKTPDLQGASASLSADMSAPSVP